jgi:hypothetical protein
MTRKTNALGALTALGIASLGLLGCPNANSYGTPRTIAPGTTQHTVALEAVHLAGNVSDTEREKITLPTLPSYQIRLGVAERVDVGIRVPNMSTLGADMKWNFVRGDVDVAIQPGVQGLIVGKAGLIYLHGGLPIGFNFSSTTTFVVTPGASYAFGYGPNPSSGQNGVVALGGLFARLSLGFAFRMGGKPGKPPKLTLFPEVTVLRSFDAGEVLSVVPGLGFQFGAAPEYDDQLDPEERPQPPPPPRPGQAAPPAPGQPASPRPAPSPSPSPAPSTPSPAPSPNPLPPPPPPPPGGAR